MADFRGVEEFVGSLFGGNALEQQAFNAATQRLIDERSKRAQMDKRVFESAISGRQNEAQEALLRQGGITADTNPLDIFSARGFTGLGDTTSGLGDLLDVQLREELQQQSEAEGFTPSNALARRLQPTPQLVPNVDIDGGIALQGLFGSDPSVNPEIQAAINAAEQASSAAGGQAGGKRFEIAQLMSALGIPEDVATKLAFDVEPLKINEKTGNVVGLDRLNRGAFEVPIQGGTTNVPPPAPPAGQTLYELALEATGPANTIQALGEQAGALTGAEFEQPATRAIQTTNTATQELIRGLAVNPRFPVSEQERILDEIKITPGFFRGPSTVRNRMQSVAQSLALRMQAAERDANDPSLDTETRSAQASNAAAIRRFLPQLGVPGFGGPPDTATAITPESRAAAGAALADVPGFNEMEPSRQERLIELWIRDNAN